MGVGAPLGADQGIPNTMQGCAVPMMRIGEPAPMGKIQKPWGKNPPPPHHRHPPIGFFPLGFVTRPIVIKKKKRKKKKKSKKK